jgi:hypothetical protein
MLDEPLNWAAAIHESAHAAAAMALGGTVYGLRLRPPGGGSCRIKFSPATEPKTLAFYQMITAYAGGVGERLLLDKDTADDCDDLIAAISRSKQYAPGDPKAQRAARRLARQRTEEILKPLAPQIAAVATMLVRASQIDPQRLLESSLPAAALAVRAKIAAAAQRRSWADA